MNPTAQFWDERYRSSTSVWSGDPNPQLIEEAGALAPGRALDVGSGEGADAMWLAARGWRVTAVDISAVALERSAALAQSAGGDLARRIEWVRADVLAWSPGERAFELVSAHFMQLTQDARDPLFRRLAAAVVPGGTLLIVGHHPSDLETTVRRPRGAGVLYTPEDVTPLLDPAAWDVIVSEARARTAIDPDGRAVTVHDTVVRARRRAETGRGRFLAAAGGAAASAFVPRRGRAQTASAPATVRVLVAPSDGVTAVVYAKHAGLFERAGLDVQLDKQNNGAAVAAGVASGSYDIGNSSVTSILLAHERGLPFTLIAPAGIYHEVKDPYSGAITLKDSPLHFGADANGQVIGVVSLNGLGQEAFCAWIDAHGGDWTSVHFVELPFAASGEALLAHRVIAAESVTPVLSTFLASGNFRFLPVYGAIAPSFLMSTWFTTRDFSARNPDVVRRFSRVVADAATYANAHHAETAPLMADFTKIPLVDVQHMPRAVGGVTLSPALIQPMIVAAAKYGNLKKAFPAQELIDPNAVT